MKTLQEQINEQAAVMTAAKNYLHDTDYQSHRDYDGGSEMPQDVKAARAQARADYNAAEAAKHQLEAQLQEEMSTPLEC